MERHEYHLQDSGRQPELTSETSPSTETRAANRPLVMIIGADEDALHLYRTALSGWKCRTVAAGSLEHSLEIAEQDPPGLVLMDMELVISKSLSVLRDLRKEPVFRGVPFILLSGHVQRNVRTVALAAGASEFFVKPVDFGHLEETLNRHLFEHTDSGN